MDMLERIKQIIEKEGLRSSSLADKIQVRRGTISHILNGRNDPSRDTIDKILNTFPHISSTWLLRGEGPYYRDQVSPAQPDLFRPEPIEQLPTPEYPQNDEAKKPEKDTNLAIIKDINISNNISKKIDKIIIFFSDKTFMTFISEE